MLINLKGDINQQVKASQILNAPDESRDEILDKFVRLASQSLNIPGSFISVLDENKQYVKASVNFELKESDRHDAFCRYVVDTGNEMIVKDTLLDVRFSLHPLVCGHPWIRFYAGVPLVNREGIILGTLCLTDTKPHDFTSANLATLKLLSKMLMSFLEAWHVAGFNDVATGLPNSQRLKRELGRLSVYSGNENHCLVIIDCIDFSRAYELTKAVGIKQLESILVDIATLLRLRLRMTSSDTLYSVGTGRYAILSKSEKRFSAAAICEKLHNVGVMLDDGIALELSVHAGEVCFFPADYSGREVISRARRALDAAIEKEIRVLNFNELHTGCVHTKDLFGQEMLTALKTGEGLYLVYQPKICLKTGKPVGLEALIRWNHVLLGELSPTDFLPVVSKNKQMATLTEWVIDAVLQQQKKWFSRSFVLPVSVNVSIDDLSRRTFANHINKKMSRLKLPRKLIEFECIEDDRITENRSAMDTLKKLKEKGFKISLDDFGSGYSNINYLRRLPLDVIKLDQLLIRDISTNLSSKIIASRIIQMLKELDYVVVAEGVENEETVMALQEYGCDQVQGFYCSKPLKAEEMDKWLEWRLS